MTLPTAVPSNLMLVFELVDEFLKRTPRLAAPTPRPIPEAIGDRQVGDPRYGSIRFGVFVLGDGKKWKKIGIERSVGRMPSRYH